MHSFSSTPNLRRRAAQEQEVHLTPHHARAHLFPDSSHPSLPATSIHGSHHVSRHVLPSHTSRRTLSAPVGAELSLSDTLMEIDPQEEGAVEDMARGVGQVQGDLLATAERDDAGDQGPGCRHVHGYTADTVKLGPFGPGDEV